MVSGRAVGAQPEFPERRRRLEEDYKKAAAVRLRSGANEWYVGTPPAERLNESRYQEFYRALVAKGMRPEMARLTLARKTATIVLILWKKGVCFDVGPSDTTNSLSVFDNKLIRVFKADRRKR